ncbi:threonylcarbamoyl-AMP synthase [Patescibacteria group bacterium]|nr:threonylcarbamoyl-AMP synthase [Patescibacteria group bacterium]MBU4512324.1 threonylcarbamoyl-AMP synthase [Patescibacteria group bacterium]MCG2693311.1 threonylcarbamoyl-AMP synthase [Candidatus Parcubacteria bacterium]
MQIQKINQKKFTSKELDKAVKILKAGGVIVYPTETCYALGGDFLSEKAVKRIYKIKHRRASFLLPVIAASLSTAKKMVSFNQKALDFAKRFWPGPVTLILKVKRAMRERAKKSGYGFLKNYDDIAIRVSSNKIARGLSRGVNNPIVSTSANISGKSECYCAEDVIQQLETSQEKPDLILDAGRLAQVKPSTIIRIKNSVVEVLRSGPVKLKYR